MHPLMIALIFVVTMALPAFVAVRLTGRPKQELALAHAPARQRLTRSEEGSVVVPTRAPETVPASPKLSVLKLAKPNKEQQASALDHQVEDTIRRLILMS
jgi:hypothetical protein